jgi:hypothetical protein
LQIAADFASLDPMSETERSVSPPVKVVEWIGEAARGHLRLLDQTRLPLETAFVDCRDALAVWDGWSSAERPPSAWRPGTAWWSPASSSPRAATS